MKRKKRKSFSLPFFKKRQEERYILKKPMVADASIFSASESQKQERAAAKKAKKIFHVAGRVFVTVFLIGALTGLLSGTTIGIYILSNIDLKSTVELSNLSLDYTSIIYAYDANGQPYETEKLYSSTNRIWVSYEDIPQYLKDGVVAIEDQRFYEHKGVDFKRTISAFANLFLNIYNTQQGGSTITQQLIKNLTGEDQVRIERKAQEIVRAINLEKKYSKEQILEAYLNTIFLSNNSYGVQMAANTYFGKNVKDLSLAECAAIIGITRYPSKYDPFRNPQNNKVRQKYVLDKMLSLGMITQQEHDTALAEPLKFKKDEAIQQSTKAQSYFTDYVVNQVIKDLVDKYGYTESYAEKLIFQGGLKIYTTMDPNIQSTMENVYENMSSFPKLAGDVQPQSAMVILGLDGKVLGMVGGRGPKEGSRVWNRATDTKRQPGSSIKPLTVYTPALEYNLVNWSTIIPDQPIDIVNDDGQVQSWPLNYYDGYYGNMTVAEAIRRSTNTVAVKIAQTLTPDVCFDFAQGRLGLSSLVSSKKVGSKIYTDKTLSAMGVGALTDGLTVLEMAAAYQPIANGGTYTQPYVYTKVEDANGNVLLETTPVSNTVIGQDTAFIMNHLMQGVVTGPNGTGAAAAMPNNIPVAAKTGTTNDSKDRWFVGLTPYYIGITWFGYDNPKRISYSGTNPALTGWKSVMKPLLTNMSYKDFFTCDSVVEKNYCLDSGQIAGPNCPNTAVGWYKVTDTTPTCALHTPTPPVTTTPSISSGGSSNNAGGSPSGSSSSSSGNSSTGTQSSSSH